MFVDDDVELVLPPLPPVPPDWFSNTAVFGTSSVIGSSAAASNGNASAATATSANAAMPLHRNLLCMVPPLDDRLDPQDRPPSSCPRRQRSGAAPVRFDPDPVQRPGPRRKSFAGIYAPAESSNTPTEMRLKT